MPTWIENCRKIIHMDFHMPEFPKEAIKNFNAEKFVQQLKRAKVDAVAIFAKDHFGLSFYNTEVGHKHSGLKQDFLGEVIEEAHRHEIKVLAYISSAWDKHNIENNPDWKQCAADNQPLLKNAEWEWGCINSPYKDESILPQIREICEKYPVDGFFFDVVMYQENGCFCKYCREKFQAVHHLPLVIDAKVTDEKLHKKFIADSVENFVKESMEIIKSYYPQSATCMNASWELGQDYRIVDNTDFMIIEAQPAHLEAGSYELLSMQSRYARTQGKPFQVVTVRFAEGWGEMTLKETHQLKYEFSVIAANGGIVGCGDQVYPDGTLEPCCYDRLEKAFAYVDEKKEAFGSRSVKEVAVYYQNGRSFPYSVRDFDHSLLGIHKCLVEAHIQYEIIDARQFGVLENYKLLIVPAATLLSGDELDAIRHYVSEGGKAVFLGNTLWSTGVKEELENLLGINAIEPFPYLCGYLKDSGYFGDMPDMPLLIKERWNKIKRVSAGKIADLHLPITVSAPPHRGFRSAYPPAQKESHYPAASINTYGKGAAIYIAADIAKAYWEFGHVWLKQIFNSVIVKELENPLLITNAPPICETNITRKDDAFYLHIVTGCMNRNNLKSYPPVESEIRLSDYQFKIRSEDVKKAVRTGSDEVIPLTKEKDGYCSFTVKLDEPYVLVKIYCSAISE